MSESAPRVAGAVYVPLGQLTAAYSAYHDLDPQHTETYAAGIAAKLHAECTVRTDDGWLLTVAGVMLTTIKLESARAMARLRKSNGATTYNR